MSRNLIALQNKFLGEGQTVYDELVRIHDGQGFVGDDDILRLAETHNLPRSLVRATAKFYDELSQDRPAKHTLKVCNGENACENHIWNCPAMACQLSCVGSAQGCRNKVHWLASNF